MKYITNMVYNISAPSLCAQEVFIILLSVIVALIIGVLQILEYSLNDGQIKTVVRNYKVAAMFLLAGYNLHALGI